MRLLGGKRIGDGFGGQQSVLAQQRRQGQSAHTAGGAEQEIAPRPLQDFLSRHKSHSRVTNSSRFRITWATATKAAASGRWGVGGFPCAGGASGGRFRVSRSSR